MASAPGLAQPLHRARPQSRAHAHRVRFGKASDYGAHSAGRKTAIGALFDPNHLTAASKTLPLGARAKVTNTRTGQSTQVTVTDRGPLAKGRILDVSPKAADQLGLKTDGVAPVKVEPIGEPTKTGAPPPHPWKLRGAGPPCAP